MKIKLLSLSMLLIILLLFSSFTSEVTIIKTQDNKFWYFLQNNEATITAIRTDETTVIIPEIIDDYPVKSIYIDGQYKSTAIKELVIPTSVSYIDPGAYGKANIFCYIETITVSEDNEHYSSKDGVLYNKDMTELITYPGLKTSTYFKIPDSVERIHGYAFECSKKLEQIELPGETCTIGGGAFSSCEMLDVIIMPEGWTEITSRCFYGSSMKRIIISDSVTEIGGGAFQNCKQLIEIELPEGLATIYSIRQGYELIEYFGMFQGCSSLEKVIIPNTVTSIGVNSFKDCIALKEITFPNSVTWIGEDAFSGCINLEAVNFGENIQTIHKTAFESCTKLDKINGQQMTIKDFMSKKNIKVDTYSVYPSVQKEYEAWVFYLCFFGVVVAFVGLIILVVAAIKKIKNKKKK